MNLIKLTTTTVIALTFALSSGAAFAQDKGETVDKNLNQAEQNVDNLGDNLKDAGKSFGNTVGNTGEAAGQGLENAGEAVEGGVKNAAETVGTEASQAANAIEEKSNWGWLGLLGLLGLFGLAGKNKTTKVVTEPNDFEYLNREDRTTMVDR